MSTSCVKHSEGKTFVPDHQDQDAALIEAICRRDEGAIAELYRRYGAAAYTLSLRLARDEELAAEAVQNTFVAVWRSARTYRPERGRVVSWLLTIARNQTLDLLRKKGGRLEVPATNDALFAEINDPAVEAEARVLSWQVRKALTSLPASLREVVELAYFRGFTHMEVAAHLQIPPGTVKSRIRLAVDRLARLLGEGGRNGG